MTPEQLRALANLCEALTECERVGMPVLDDTRDEPALAVRLVIGTPSYGAGGHQWLPAGLRVYRDLGVNSEWTVDRR